MPNLLKFYAASISKLTIKKPPIKNKIKIILISFLFVFVFNMSFSVVGIWLHITEVTNSSYFTHMVFCSAMALGLIVTLIPIMVQMGIFAECVGNLTVWAQLLDKEIIVGQILKFFDNLETF